MAIIIYGVNKTAIGVDEFLIKCPSCERQSWADIMIISKYFHIFLVPVFPTDKEANVICKTCGLKRHGMAFDQDLITNYNEVKTNYRHPWFAYLGLTIIILIFTSIILFPIL